MFSRAALTAQEMIRFSMIPGHGDGGTEGGETECKPLYWVYARKALGQFQER